MKQEPSAIDVLTAAPGKGVLVAVLIAAVLWFYMFSPWTAGWPNFWLVMSVSATILTSLAFALIPDRKALVKVENPRFQIVAGVVIAFALWGIFWIGDKASAWLFDFARPQVDNVYAMKTGLPSWLIALLLLFVIGPAEELFWRGYVQRTLARLWTPNLALVVTVAIYTLVHIWSFNFMLIMAALVAGLVWGLLYRLKPTLLPALVVSHALWDALVFVVLPI